MSESVTLKSYFYEVLIPSSQKNTSSPIEDILHHVSISFMKKLALYKCFNPRTHTGCDIVGGGPSGIVAVSIHAPTRGATNTIKPTLSFVKPFQSTHPHGVRPSCLAYCWIAQIGVNPRTHTGCDLIVSDNLYVRICFNPRTHTGCDSVQSYIL